MGEQCESEITSQEQGTTRRDTLPQKVTGQSGSQPQPSLNAQPSNEKMTDRCEKMAQLHPKGGEELSLPTHPPKKE